MQSRWSKVSIALAALAFPALSLATTLPAQVRPGFYVGDGDGANVVLYVMPDGKAKIGAFNEYSGMGFHPKPVTPARVVKAGTHGYASTYTYNPKTGELDVSTPVPAFAGQSANACIHEYKAESPVAFLETGTKVAHGGKGQVVMVCGVLHGATWGFSGPNTALKWYAAE
ncbi:hypothetical protein HF288_10805 [Acidithiobacillus caldus]|uniref:hypothetical protein n=1 Tax=Acidithiobacillus caldus TaxID=33059 RepID=UPI001C07D8B9|nr:hypothetical protein [Acidithiobacillus caldus]MBU2789852.1 hypothetical protein [Acidithiobacillus caldus]MBU2821797.1 hypothetical protein [Acidithiobacillus caldus]